MYDSEVKRSPNVAPRSPCSSASGRSNVALVGSKLDTTRHIIADAQEPGDRTINHTVDGTAGCVWRERQDVGTVPASYFDDIYAKSDDPWDFETSEYEADKYRHTLASLPKARYARALEVGCSIGVLTQQLASRCDELLSVDVSERALTIARQRCANLPK